MENIKPVENKKESKLIKWAIIFGIVIVLNMFFNYAISLVYKEPTSPYANQAQIVSNYANQADCLAVGGQWSEGDANYPKGAPVPVGIGTQVYKGSCDPYFTKQKDFENAQKIYQRNLFIILSVLGVVSLITGAFMINEIVSLGLSWGGVISLIIASMRYWSTADNLIKVIILGVALGALIWLAIKKFGK